MTGELVILAVAPFAFLRRRPRPPFQTEHSLDVGLRRTLRLEPIQDVVVVAEEGAGQGIVLEYVVKGITPGFGGFSTREAPDAVELAIPEEHNADVFWAWPDEQSGDVAAGQRVKPEREGPVGVGGHYPVYRARAPVA